MVPVYPNWGTARNKEKLSCLKRGMLIIGPTRIQAVSGRNPNLFGAVGNGSPFFRAISNSGLIDARIIPDFGHVTPVSPGKTCFEINQPDIRFALRNRCYAAILQHQQHACSTKEGECPTSPNEGVPLTNKLEAQRGQFIFNIR